MRHAFRIIVCYFSAHFIWWAWNGFAVKGL